MGFGTFFRNVTLTGGVAPARAYIEELMPDVLDGTIEPGRVFDRTIGLDETPDGYRADGRPRGPQGADRAMTLLLQDRDDRGVVTLTLNRPQAFNALVRGDADRARCRHCRCAGSRMIRCGPWCSGLPVRRSAPGMTSRKCGPSRRWSTTSGCSPSAPR